MTEADFSLTTGSMEEAVKSIIELAAWGRLKGKDGIPDDNVCDRYFPSLTKDDKSGKIQLRISRSIISRLLCMTRDYVLREGRQTLSGPDLPDLRLTPLKINRNLVAFYECGEDGFMSLIALSRVDNYQKVLAKFIEAFYPESRFVHMTYDGKEDAWIQTSMETLNYHG